MSLEKCPDCSARMRKGTLELHRRHCVRYRKRIKAEAAQVVLEKKKRGRKKKNETIN